MDLQLISQLEGELEQLFEEGKEIYQKNKFMKDIAEFMEHPIGKDVFNKYLSNRSEIEQALIFMRLYNEITENFEEKYNLNGYQKIALTIRAVQNPNIREHICMKMTNWIKKIQ